MPYSEDIQPCLWMSAGLLTYCLCDRDFDCDCCPLDAALRRDRSGTRRDTLLAPQCDAQIFPEDRLYASGHLWVQATGEPEDRLFRVGLDAFAAAIIGRCRAIRWQAPERALAQGEPICQIDTGLGAVSVGAPLRGVLVDGNRRLLDDASPLVTAPYENGWLARLVATDPSDLSQLCNAAAVRKTARMDLQRFRRRVALQLLAEGDDVGRTLNDGGEPLADLRQILGGPTYLDILREFIH
jgi:glycine cleavage system H protein